MPKLTPIKRLKSVLKDDTPPAVKAVNIIKLAHKLPSAAIDVMDNALDAANPIVQVAIMDAYFEMTEDSYHKDDLERILCQAANVGDANEELYMAARLALGHISGFKKDALNKWGDSGIEISAITAKRRRPVKRKAVAKRKVGRRPTAMPHVPRNSITIMIHGTWASDGEWWRPGGDFFEYVKKDLFRPDLYSEEDQFRWSGKNREYSRKNAATSLGKWLQSHPADEINVFAHSHGANIAMLATHNDIHINRLVMLSPPVREDYFAKWSNVSDAFNIQAEFDPVVAIARGGQWFRRANVKEKKLKASGHSVSHDPNVWRSEKLDKFIRIPW